MNSPDHCDSDEHPREVEVEDSGLAFDDDDVLPSFGPQLTISDPQDTNPDIVDFAQINLDYYNQQDNIVRQWAAIRNSCVDELHRHDGLTSKATRCYGFHCHNVFSPSSSFRCLDGMPHEVEPFHRIERWNGKFWTRESLTDHGLVVNLGQGRESCPYPLSNLREMQVIDTNGVFTMKVKFCGCSERNNTLNLCAPAGFPQRSRRRAPPLPSVAWTWFVD
ncbi:hypothetical protein SCHPADRAFT_984381 [Schizopora paradoxa]|uniref:CxC2-like cysteine cluster KDZ transposase-associated domain-containing protein n=1 Tax=Schizopora paradoxa TaxID=27342 RepID=A0A0H2R7E6_9AGAM|nr:hypothetical protein SCHPADRAFT_984381 [Schizopora paradoxa]